MPIDLSDEFTNYGDAPVTRIAKILAHRWKQKPGPVARPGFCAFGVFNTTTPGRRPHSIVISRNRSRFRSNHSCQNRSCQNRSLPIHSRPNRHNRNHQHNRSNHSIRNTS